MDILASFILSIMVSVVAYYICKWLDGLSVPDAELLIQLAEVLDVEVSDLLGEKREISEGQSKTDTLALELAKLNELLVVYGNKLTALKKKAVIAIAVILFVIFVCAIFGPWTDMWHEIGNNIYHMFND